MPPKIAPDTLKKLQPTLRMVADGDTTLNVVRAKRCASLAIEQPTLLDKCPPRRGTDAVPNFDDCCNYTNKIYTEDFRLAGAARRLGLIIGPLKHLLWTGPGTWMRAFDASFPRRAPPSMPSRAVVLIIA